MFLPKLIKCLFLQVCHGKVMEKIPELCLSLYIVMKRILKGNILTPQDYSIFYVVSNSIEAFDSSTRLGNFSGFTFVHEIMQGGVPVILLHSSSFTVLV